MNAQIFALFALMAVAAVMAECPEENGEHSVYLANPKNCSTYYQCDHGVAVLRVCGEGTEWNAEEETCDWPENAGCVVEQEEEEHVEEEEKEEHVAEEGEGAAEEEVAASAVIPPAATFPRHA